MRKLYNKRFPQNYDIMVWNENDEKLNYYTPIDHVHICLWRK